MDVDAAHNINHVRAVQVDEFVSLKRQWTAI